MSFEESKKSLLRGDLEGLKSPSGGFRGLALITGGSRGIGFGIAIELAKAGFNLAINGVREQKAVQPVLDGLKMFGARVIYAQGSVADSTERQNIFDTVI
jgi:NAD(P)-dependent dehydrogenase (short-subunit alcohol dehydrogenase family)